jgi:hypothetical protein
LERQLCVKETQRKSCICPMLGFWYITERTYRGILRGSFCLPSHFNFLFSFFGLKLYLS